VSLPPVSPRQLEYLVAVADTGTMTAAAARCHVTQSAVSLAVTELERMLGVRLVIRGPGRRSGLTAAGQEVAAQARTVLNAISELGTAARSLGDDLAGELRVGCYTPLAALHLPVAIASFRERHPEVSISFVEGNLAELQRRLLDGSCELALLYRQDIEPGIATEVLYDQAPNVLLPAGHRLARRTGIALRDLAPDPFVLLDVFPSALYFASVFDAAGVQTNVAHRATNFELARALVARGLGYSLSVQKPPIEVSVEGLPFLVRPLRDRVPTTPVVLARAGGGRLTRRASTFAAFCRELFSAGVPLQAQ
jgi:DNA-binding transcriptional LysR family regulator